MPGWRAGERHFHLDRESPFLRQHHRNWRLQALRALDGYLPKNLHYSAVFSLSEEDAAALKEFLLQHLKSFLETVAASKEEKIYVYNFDFFETGG